MAEMALLGMSLEKGSTEEEEHEFTELGFVRVLE